MTTNTDTVNTGKHDHDRIWQYVRYQNMSSLYACTAPSTTPPFACPSFQHEWDEFQARQHGWTPIWGSARANQISGTDASQFKRPFKSSEAVVFVDDLFQSRNTSSRGADGHLEEVELKGIPVHRYRLRKEDLLNSTNNPGNADFFMNGPDGLLNLSSALGVPIFMSKPHYLDAEPKIGESIEGLHPSVEAHDTFLDVEPYSGTTMREAKRLMFSTFLDNWHLSKSPAPAGDLPWKTTSRAYDDHQASGEKAKASGIGKCLNPVDYCGGENWEWDISSKWPRGLYVPYAWVEETEELTDSDADLYKNEVVHTFKLADDLCIAGFVIGGACVLAMAAVAIHQRRDCLSATTKPEVEDGEASDMDGRSDPLLAEGQPPASSNATVAAMQW